VPQLKQEFKELFLPRRALSNEEEQSQGWQKSPVAYFTGTLQVILGCVKVFSHAFQELLSSVLLLHSENPCSSKFSH